MSLRTRNPAGGKHGGYGWVPDLPDHRDRVFEPDAEALKRVSQLTSFDLTSDPAMPEVWNQGQLGSCTAHAVGGSFAFAHTKAGHPAMMPSRLWIYYQERVIEGTVDQDAGAMIRDGFKACATVGVPPESDWPYDISTFVGPPSQTADTDAVQHKDLTYQSIPQDETQIKAALIAGFPVSFGFTVYDSFESPEVAQTGVMPMPKSSEGVLGGHAVLAVGFENDLRAAGVEISKKKVEKDGYAKVRNSWSKDWGLFGYFWMPYKYLLDPNLCDDFWQATLAS